MAGKYDGSTQTKLSSVGSTDYIGARLSTGQYRFTFAVPLLNDNYVISLAVSGYVYIAASSTTSFSVIAKNYQFNVADMPVYFTVLAA